MKKLIVLTLCVFCASLAQAESMQFVTLLSQPVGSFAKVKLLDAGKAADIENLNFCQPSLDGTIDVASGGMEVEKTLDVKTTLGGDVGAYATTSSIVLTAGDNPVLTGKSLSVNGEMSIPSNAEGTLKSVKINSAAAVNIGGSVTSKVASFKTMDLKDKAVLKNAASRLSGTLSKSTMTWAKHTKEGCAGENCSPTLLMGTPSLIHLANPGWSIRNPGLIVDGVLNQQVTTIKPNVSVLP